MNANGFIIHIQLRCFIADAPARAFILNHVGHNARSPCSKCTIQGQYIGHRMVFLGTKYISRSDEKYRSLTYKNHNLGETSLSQLLDNLIHQVPFESMHLVYLGIAKKILVALITGEYNKKIKLKTSKLKLLSDHLELIKKYCPSEFSRRQRIITEYVRYKATEFRQFLLYTGPVIFHNILEKSIYSHFLILTTAIRILNLPILSKSLLTFADIALKKFVEICPYIYGPRFMSYNIHGLLHISEDVQRYGPLDSFSAFAYENEMSTYKKLCRKPHLLLQQISNRLEELTKNNVKYYTNSDVLIAFQKHSNGPLPTHLNIKFEQYKSIKVKNMLFSITQRNNCCILNDLSICIIINILKKDEVVMFAVKKFKNIGSFLNIGIPSSEIGFFKCSDLANEIHFVPLEEVKCKCFRMPLCVQTRNIETNNTYNSSNLYKNYNLKFKVFYYYFYYYYYMYISNLFLIFN